MEPLAPTAAPIITDDLNNLNLSNNANQTINLLDHFDDPFTTGRVARFELESASFGTGVTEVLLFDQRDEGAPIAAENFIRYVTDGDYRNTIIHRSVPDFIIQGGGFAIDGLASVLNTDPASAVTLVPTDPPIQNEFSSARSNTLGTIALAKLGGEPDSATSQFFFNLNDNSGNLDVQNGGFTVFGEILGTEDLKALEAIADLPTSNETTLFNQGAFTDLPLIVDDPTNPVINGDENLVRYQDISVSQRDELVFEVVSNSNPAVVTLNLAGGNLQLESQSELGSSTITVRATNLVGAVIEDTFTVTVTDAPIANEAPTTTGISDITVEEDSDNTIIDLFDAFSDREDDDGDLTYTVTNNSNLTLFTSTEINATNGELILDYETGQSGEADLTIEATDTNNQTVSTIFSVTVNAANAVPVGIPDFFSTTSDSPLVVSVANGILNNDTADDSDTLVANLESEPDNGTLQLNRDGSFTYTPETGFIGVDTFSYTASDGDADSNVTTVSLQVNALPAIPDDAIQGSERSNSIKGGNGADYLAGFGEGDRLRGRQGDDTIDGGIGDDTIKGHRGNDLIDGGADNDLVRAGKGDDTVFGGIGFDFIKGQKGNDVLVGGDGNDLLHGEKGNDLLIGGNQDDYLRGGNGNDTLIGGSGNDTLRGNRGDDLYVLSTEGGTDEFEKFKLGQDLIGLADGITFGALSFETNGNTTGIFFEDALIANVHQTNGGNLANQANFVASP